MNLGPSVPEGFDAFWTGLSRVGSELPLDWSLGAEAPGTSATHRVRTLTARGSDGKKLHGWVADPGDGPWPAFLWSPPYGRWSMLPDEYGTRAGYASCSFNLFGEGAFHREAYTPARGYFAHGAESPDQWVFRRIFLDSVVALRVLGALPSVDPSRVGAMGMSQGAGLSLWLGASRPEVKAVVADMPFLSGSRFILSQSHYRYPVKELVDWMGDDPGRREALLHTMSHYDTVNVATRCTQPTLVTAGAKDPAVKPAQARAVFEALAGPKAFEEMDGGHDWHPSMVERNRAWLDRWL